MKQSSRMLVAGARTARTGVLRVALMGALVSGTALAGVASFAPAAHAQTTLTVTNLAASGPGSLADAIAAANAASGDTITFTPGLSGIISPAATLDIGAPVTISGPGSNILSVSGAGIDTGVSHDGVFMVGGSATVTISGLTIENGENGPGGNCDLCAGGGIANEGTLTATNDTFLDDSAEVGGAIATGVFVTSPEKGVSGEAASAEEFTGFATAAATVADDTFQNDTATVAGGAIFNEGTLTTSGDTFSDDSSCEGGAISNGIGIGCVSPGPFRYSGSVSGELLEPTVVSTNDTFFENSATEGVGGGALYNYWALAATNDTFVDNSGYGGALFNDSDYEGTVTLSNSILADGGAESDNCHWNGDRSGITDGGYNVEDQDTCGLGSTSLVDQSYDAIFGPSPAPQLEENGGPTETVAIPTSSDAASLAQTNCPATDQRGFARPSPGCSTGAYQVGAPVTTIGAPPGPPLCPTTVVAGIGEVTITWCAPTNDNGSPVTCYQIYRWTTGTTAVLLANVCPGVAGANEKSTSTVRGSPADPTYVDTAVVCGSIYFYDTTASNTYGASVPSNVVSAAPGCGPGRGPAPSLQACSGETGNAAFVCAAYVDILGRAPDPGGLAYWEAALSSGESTGAVAAGIMSSGEFQADIVFGDYELFLGRAPDPGGLSFWEGELAAGTTDEQVIAGIAGSPEFGSRSGGTPAGIVGALYEDLLGRAPDPGGLAYWEGALSSGESTGAVATGICSSAEYRAGLVSDYYEHFLARGVDPAGLSFWEGRLAAGATDEQVMAGIVGSPEYYAEVTG